MPLITLESAPAKTILNFELELSLRKAVRFDLSSLEKPSVTRMQASLLIFKKSSKACIEDFPLKSILILSSLSEAKLTFWPQRKNLQSILSVSCNSQIID